MTKIEAKKDLLERINVKEGDKIYIIQRSVSRSGMTRRLSVLHQNSYGLEHITYAVADLLGWSQNKVGMKVDGCGMDMHFHTVYSMAQALFGDGYKLECETL
jgi:hypothetical protein